MAKRKASIEIMRFKSWICLRSQEESAEKSAYKFWQVALGLKENEIVSCKVDQGNEYSFVVTWQKMQNLSRIWFTPIRSAAHEPRAEELVTQEFSGELQQEHQIDI